jgi:hypothetical protein
MGFLFLILKSDYFLNSINQFIYATVKCYVLFEVRSEFLNNIYMSFVTLDSFVIIVLATESRVRGFKPG